MKTLYKDLNLLLNAKAKDASTFREFLIKGLKNEIKFKNDYTKTLLKLFKKNKKSKIAIIGNSFDNCMHALLITNEGYFPQDAIILDSFENGILHYNRYKDECISYGDLSFEIYESITHYDLEQELKHA